MTSPGIFGANCCREPLHKPLKSDRQGAVRNPLGSRLRLVRQRGRHGVVQRRADVALS